jgi:hypothetical protein
MFASLAFSLFLAVFGGFHVGGHHVMSPFDSAGGPLAAAPADSAGGPLSPSPLDSAGGPLQ